MQNTRLRQKEKRMSIRRTTALAVASILAAVTLSACNDGTDAEKSNSSSPAATRQPTQNSSPDPSSAPSEGLEWLKDGIDPTTIVTPTDVRAVLGNSFSLDSKSEGVVGSSSERNASYIGADHRTLMVQVKVDDRPAGAVWQAALDAAKNGVAGVDPYYAPFMNGGDASFVTSLATACAYKGTTVVEINLLGEDTTSANSKLLIDLLRRAMRHVK